MPEFARSLFRWTAPRTVRGRLITLVLLMLLPTVGVSLIAGLAVYFEEKAAVTGAAVETAKALSLVTDRELAVRAAVLRTLATSQALRNDDLATFYREAKAVVPTNENTIILSDASGQQLLNTRLPFGAGPLPKSTTLAAAPSVVEPTTLVISSLYMAPLGKRYSFAVHVPVMRDGKVRWYLGMGSFASQLQSIFAQQPLPAGWVGSVLDAQGNLVARNTQAEQLVGRRATDDMLRAIALAPHGVHETQTLVGVPVFTAFNRAPASGWTVLIGMPQQEIRQPAWRAFGLMMLVSVLFSAVALAMVARVGRSIVEPVLRLQADAESLGRSEAVQVAQTGLEETDAVQQLLAQASVERLQADDRLRSRVHDAVAETERVQRALLGVQKLEALGRLTGGIAHDFNNLLQTMSTGLQLARRLAQDDRARSALATCDRAVSKAVTLTRQLMTFGRTQPGHLAVVDLAHQLDSFRDLMHGAVRDAIVVHVAVEPGVWSVKVDPVQLELAVLNLVLNARDAIGDRGNVWVRATNRRPTAGELDGMPAGDFVALSVRDDGEGMSADVQQRVFEPFFTTKPIGKGSGLGLAQVYGFAQQAGGTATVHSTPGQGTEVTVWMPRTLEEPGPAGPAPEPPMRATYSGTVLFVEDDALVRGLTADALEEFGFKVIVASTGDDGLAIARSRADIDVVLSDIVMPGGQSGLDMARTLRVVRPALPVVLASGYAEALATDLPVPVVAKPYDVNAVARQLAAAIGAAQPGPARPD